MGRRAVAGHKRTTLDLGAWLCWEDEAGQNLRPPKARTWAPRGRTPLVHVTGKGYGRVALAGLVCARPGRRTRLIYRALIRRGRPGEVKGFGTRQFAALLDAAHVQLGGPIVLVWDKCAVRRFVVSLTQLGGIWRNIPGSPDLPGGESRRGPQHVREAVTV
jgi:putative transposase